MFKLDLDVVSSYWVVEKKKTSKKQMQEPGIEPGAQRWQRWILPLNHSCNWAIKGLGWQFSIISLPGRLIYKACFYYLFITLVVKCPLGIWAIFYFHFRYFFYSLVRRVLDITKLVVYWVAWWFLVTLVFGLYKGQKFPFSLGPSSQDIH